MIKLNGWFKGLEGLVSTLSPRWDDLVLRLDADGDICRVQAEALSGEARVSFAMSDLKECLKPLTNRCGLHREGATKLESRDLKGEATSSCFAEQPERTRQLGHGELRKLGCCLFDLLFQGRVRQLYGDMQGRSSASDASLRLVLQMDLHDPSGVCLARVPWELLHDGQRFLVRQPRHSIARHLELLKETRSLELPVPLHVLGAAANPAGTVPLNLAQEMRVLKSLHQTGRFHVDVIEDARWDQIEWCLLDAEEKANPFHVFQFMGHAGFDEDEGEGSIFVEGQPSQIRSSCILELFDNLPNLRLVFLNACRTGMNSGQPWQDPFAGLSAAATLGGVPIVLSMRERVTDSGAIRFSGEFNRALAERKPVDEAVSRGRRALALQSSRKDEWAHPILFLRGHRFRYPQLRTLLWQVWDKGPLVGAVCGLVLGQLFASLIALAQDNPVAALSPWLHFAVLGFSASLAALWVHGRPRGLSQVMVSCLVALGILGAVQRVIPIMATIRLDALGVPSGWMSGSLPPSRWLAVEKADNCFSGDSCLYFTFKPGGGWAGVYWWPTSCDDPDPVHGELKRRSGACGVDVGRAGDLREVRRLVFYARGKEGGEVIEFKVGADDFSPRPSRSTGEVTLTKDWCQYDIDLQGVDLSQAVGLFAWFAADDLNPQGARFYLDAVAFEGVR